MITKFGFKKKVLNGISISLSYIIFQNNKQYKKYTKDFFLNSSMDTITPNYLKMN